MRAIARALGFVALALWAASPSQAGLPSQGDPYTETLAKVANGYPSGVHFNLNIIGKTPDYPCSTPRPVDGVYGNVLFIPDDGQRVQILMESGAKGPKSQRRASVLEVTDACAGFEGNDSAALRLPAHAEGYAVFARAPGKPSKDATVRIYDPPITYVAAFNANANPLFFLGVVSPDGVFTSSRMSLDRPTGDGAAQNITSLFLWSGMVCYPRGFPPEHADLSADAFSPQCCTVTDSNSDGVPDAVGACGLEVLDPISGRETCTSGWLSCVDHPSETWVFGIADVADAVWKTENNGVKDLQIRFYPLPLETQISTHASK